MRLFTFREITVMNRRKSTCEYVAVVVEASMRVPPELDAAVYFIEISFMFTVGILENRIYMLGTLLEMSKYEKSTNCSGVLSSQRLTVCELFSNIIARLFMYNSRYYDADEKNVEDPYAFTRTA